ncbi:MAG: hypothetical protein JW781_04815 [Deltaproteobacteria bacterium]|nr:hypothetical protein [Candidatus Anaeroferrophillacea bacterium]
MRYNRIFLLALALTLLTASQVRAGAWTMPRGKLYARLAYSQYDADRFFDLNGNSQPYSPGDGKKRDFEYKEKKKSIYLEYGVWDRLTMITALDYKECHFTYLANSVRVGPQVGVDKAAYSSGLADVQFGLKYQVWSWEKGVLSVQGLMKTGEAYDHRHTGPLDIQLGDAQDDYEFRLLYGQSLYPTIPGYCNLEAGYRVRSQAPSDEFRYLAEFGLDFGPHAYARAKFSGTMNTGDGDAYSGQVDANGNEIDLGTLEVVMGIKVSERWGAELGYTDDVFGESTTNGSTWTAALTFYGL